MNKLNRDYIIIYANNNIYHIPLNFLNSHPGGPESIIKKDNQECSLDFNFHNKKGQKEWEKFKVSKQKDNYCLIC